jgi:hypothetical protein
MESTSYFGPTSDRRSQGRLCQRPLAAELHEGRSRTPLRARSPELRGTELSAAYRRDGYFCFVDRDPIQEESYSVFEALFGHVGPRSVTGLYEYRFSKSYLSRWVQCQMNTFAYGPSEARFRARRVR